VSAGRIAVECVRECAATPETVFALLRDSSTYPSWSQIRAYEMERPGNDEPHGIGEIRVFYSSLPIVVREEIVELVPNTSMAYTLLSGLPMRDYRGETTLQPLNGGRTRITWRSTFNGVWGNGWAMRLFMKWVLSTLTTALARAAEARSSSAAATAAAAASAEQPQGV